MEKKPNRQITANKTQDRKKRLKKSEPHYKLREGVDRRYSDKVDRSCSTCGGHITTQNIENHSVIEYFRVSNEH